MQVELLGGVLWDYLRIGSPLERREAIVAFAQPDIIGFEKLVNELVGQVDRVEKYPDGGFTAKAQVPEEVIAAKRQLIELGFSKHLISEVDD
jgi:hypothetical protein